LIIDLLDYKRNKIRTTQLIISQFHSKRLF
jgi:hypothetical protein